MADMKKVYDDLIIINLYWSQLVYENFAWGKIRYLARK